MHVVNRPLSNVRLHVMGQADLKVCGVRVKKEEEVMPYKIIPNDRPRIFTNPRDCIQGLIKVIVDWRSKGSRRECSIKILSFYRVCSKIDFMLSKILNKSILKCGIYDLTRLNV